MSYESEVDDKLAISMIQQARKLIPKDGSMSKELIARLRSVQNSSAQYVAGSDIIRESADALEEAYRTIEAQRALYANCTEIARKLEIAREAFREIKLAIENDYNAAAYTIVTSALEQLGDTL